MGPFSYLAPTRLTALGLWMALAASPVLAMPQMGATEARPSASQCSIDSLSETLTHARENLMKLRLDGAYWNLPSYLGTHYVSQYYLVLRFLDRVNQTQLDSEQLKRVLLENQLADGSWFTVKDANIATGDLNASIFNYWALKTMGLPMDSEPLLRAAKWIRSRGGLEAGSLFTKIFLALFGVGSWNDIPEIPYLLFKSWSPLNERDFAQWVGPHLLPIAYLKKMEVTLSHALFSDPLAELKTSPGKRIRPRSNPPIPGRAEKALISKMLELQQPRGSFGAYTSATVFAILAFDHFQTHSEFRANALSGSAERGFQFIESMMLGSGESAYKGTVDDGRYWDTALVGIAARESGLAPEELAPTSDYLIARAQTNSGGFAFGEDFWYAPDTDDTAEILLLLAQVPQTASVKTSAERAVRWLLSMQNSDGGWGAFARNNYGNVLLAQVTRDFLDSADLFDESSVDVTGHIIEALSVHGLHAKNSKAVRKAIRYILKQQEASGSWMGRWGINHLYGTSAAVVGLVAAGISPESAPIQRALEWLRSVQNNDGGFGESSSSYKDRKAWGKGISTPSQTAWALQTFLSGAQAHSPQARAAAEYLVQDFKTEGTWVDRSTVGTGHPVIVYMNYPSYPLAFPLIALSRYQHACAEDAI